MALDIGGTKVAAGLVSDTGSVLVEDRVATGRRDGGEDLYGAVLGLVESVRGRAPAVPVVLGVGCGGPMAPGGEEVSPLNIGAWRDFPLRARLARDTGLATFVDNDAKALALGEGWCGAAADCRNFMAMVVSTGVGGGIVVDGRLLDGKTANAGHVGHLVVEPDGRRCACGSQGCLEAEASGPSIEAVTGRPPIEASPEVVARTGRMVGRAVASVAVLLDLPLTVVAGSVALGFGQPFFAAAQDEIDRRARISFARGAAIVPGGLGAAGPLVGAAAVGWRALGHPGLPG